MKSYNMILILDLGIVYAIILQKSAINKVNFSPQYVKSVLGIFKYIVDDEGKGLRIKANLPYRYHKRKNHSTRQIFM